MEALGPSLRDRVVSAEDLCIRWLETRTQMELAAYPHIVGLARRVIAEAFSSRVITPGVTRTAEVYWYIRERFEALDLAPEPDGDERKNHYEAPKLVHGVSRTVRRTTSDEVRRLLGNRNRAVC